MTRRLTSLEDSTLRALHWLETAGVALCAAYRARKAELRRRDLRATVRAPEDDVVLRPVDAPQD